MGLRQVEKDVFLHFLVSTRHTFDNFSKFHIVFWTPYYEIVKIWQKNFVQSVSNPFLHYYDYIWYIFTAETETQVSGLYPIHHYEKLTSNNSNKLCDKTAAEIGSYSQQCGQYSIAYIYRRHAFDLLVDYSCKKEQRPIINPKQASHPLYCPSSFKIAFSSMWLGWAKSQSKFCKERNLVRLSSK